MAGSLITELLQIQQCADTSLNSRYDWATKLKFLHATDEHGCLLLRRENTEGVFGRFIALSYTWTPSAFEDDRAGQYTIIKGSGSSPIRSEVRNVVFSRSLRFARFHNITRLWIDRECVNQSDPKEMAKAVQCMDFVYSKSAFPLGLLTTELRNNGDIDLLEALLTGDIVPSVDDVFPTINNRVSRNKCRQAFNLILRLGMDVWWSRRWTFQEEYKSSERMTLLIPHAKGLRKSHDFGGIDREFRVQAIHFRMMATLFLLAWLQRCPRFHQRLAKTLFVRIGSYKVLYALGFGPRLALSPRIYTDLLVRHGSEAWDTPSILANTCGYRKRLDISKLQKMGSRLGACLVALYFMNGELFCNNVPQPVDFTENDLPRLFNTLAPDMTSIPTLNKSLTFAKHCRLRNPRITRVGIQTQGLLWEICEILSDCRPDPFAARSHSQRNRISSLNDSQRICLQSLAQQLQQSGRRLRRLYCSLCDYLERGMRIQHSPAVEDYMDKMAEEIAEAIHQRRPLHLARTHSQTRSSDILGIFTNLPPDVNYVFTSWEAPVRGADLDWNVCQERHVSLAVELEEEQHLAKIRYAGWVNGLFFASGVPLQNLVYCWPPNWV